MRMSFPVSACEITPSSQDRAHAARSTALDLGLVGWSAAIDQTAWGHKHMHSTETCNNPPLSECVLIMGFCLFLHACLYCCVSALFLTLNNAHLKLITIKFELEIFIFISS